MEINFVLEVYKEELIKFYKVARSAEVVGDDYWYSLYKKIKPMVYSGHYPGDSDDYDNLRQALEKLKLKKVSK